MSPKLDVVLNNDIIPMSNRLYLQEQTLHAATLEIHKNRAVSLSVYFLWSSAAL